MDRTTPRPTEIKLHQASRILEVTFDDGKQYRLPCEYLRVYSPSAEVRGHGPGQEVLQVGKSEVGISAVEPVGVYAVKLTFTDGHDTGIFSWDYLYDLGLKQEANWKIRAQPAMDHRPVQVSTPPGVTNFLPIAKSRDA